MNPCQNNREIQRAMTVKHQNPSMSLEMTVLCYCARLQLTDSEVTDLQILLQQKVDWRKFLGLAERHYVVPLVYRTLQGAGFDNIPADVLNNLRVRFKIIKWRNQMMLEELLRLAALLDANKLPVIHYKGVMAAFRHYGDVSLRTYNDLDFLVRREDMQALFRLLRDEGYSNGEDFKAEHQVHIERELKEYNFKCGHVSLEPHWSITARRFPFEIDYEGLWQRADVQLINDQALLSFSPEDELLILCVVGSKGRWQRLQMVSDVAQCVRQCTAIDWHQLQNRAENTGSLRMLGLGLLLAAELLNAPVPDMILHDARADSVLGKLAREVIRHLDVKRPERRFVPNTSHMFSSQLYRMRERWSDRMSYLLRTTTTPTGMHLKRLPLPNVLYPMYYLFTPFHDYVLYPGIQLAKQVFGKDRN